MPARRLGPRNFDRPPRRRRRASGTRARERYLAPRPAADATHPGGAGTAAAPPAFFNVAFRRNEPLPRGRATPPRRRPEPRLVARQASRARRSPSGDISRAPRRRRLRQARRRRRPTTAACRRPARSTASSPATSRPRRAPTSPSTACRRRQRRRHQLPGPVPGQPPALRDLRPAASRSRRRATGMTLLLHSLGGALQPVRRQPQPVAVRRARPRLDRDHARVARARRLLRRLSPAPTCSRSWADVARHYKLDPDWTVDHRLLDGRLSARSSSASSSPTCSPSAQPTVGDLAPTTTSSSRCATSRC